MQLRRRWLVWGPCFALLMGAWSARAQQTPHEVSASLELLPGYDSNPTLALNPNARRDATVALDGPRPGGVINALGNAYATLGRTPWLGVALSTDARLYASADARHDTSLSLSAGTEVGRLRLSLSTLGGRYDASFGTDDAWYASFSPAIRWSFSQQVSVGLEGHAGVRRYASGAQTNWDAGGTLDLQLRRDTWLAALGVDADRRQSNDAAAARGQLTPFATIAWWSDALFLSLRYAAFARSFDLGEQDGVEHTAEVSARYRLGTLISLSARVGAGLARGQVDALSYERWYAMTGLTFTLGAAGRRVPREIDRSQQGAAEVSEQATRFTVCLDDTKASAREVSVVGTFNAWSVDAGRMRRVDARCFAVELVVPPGHHRYQWMVDGQLVRPDSAPAYVSDGFGGEDAVLIVPE